MRTVIRVAWVIYALGLCTATHLPGVVIDGPIPRTDVVIHLVCFGGWTALFIACGFFGVPLSRHNILRSWGIAAVYCIIDELTQGIPGLNRIVDPLDAAANLAGTIIPMLIALGFSHARKSKLTLKS